MLGRKTITTQITFPGVPALPATNQFTSGELELSFFVEEDEMLVDLELKLVLTATTGDLDATFFVDGTNLGGGTAVALSRQQALTGAEVYVNLRTTQRFAAGTHIVEARLAAVSAAVINGDVVPGELVARRHSHPATLGHGVDSKGQLIQ